MRKEQVVKFSSWGLAGFVVALAALVWAGERLDGSKLTLYEIFPLLGLAAFSLMWSHYIVGAVRRGLSLEAGVNRTYLRVTGFLVLLLILLHPGLLIFQLNQDGFGLPPASYLEVYSEPAMKFAIMLGTISLLLFLAFELKRRFHNHSWWRFIEYAQVLAMLLIFYHGLSLGRELSEGWYRVVWYSYGVTLLLSVGYTYWWDRKRRRG